MDTILVFTKTGFWSQSDSSTYRVGNWGMLLTKKSIVYEAQMQHTPIFDASKIKPKVMERLIRKFYNGRGLVDDLDVYIDALLLNGAKETTK